MSVAKGANLAWLSDSGYRVPPFVVLSTSACERLISAAQDDINGQLAGLDTSNRTALRQCAAAIHDRITGLSFPDDLAAALRVRTAALGGVDARFAVRSSISGEDSATSSFAGQFETELNVPANDVPAAVLRCLASAYSERSLFYRARRGLSGEQISAAVVVQVLIDGVVSGVAFSCNPQSGSTDEAVVTAGLGLGEGVVNGTVDCDTFFVDRSAQSITARLLNAKRSRVIPKPGGGTVVEAVEQSDVPVLRDEQVLELAQLVGSLADALNGPQDVEWTIDRDAEIHLLQTRPVTTLHATQIILDNVNVAESYPGLTSPLTFTFVQRAYAEVFRVCHRYFGATKKTVAANTANVYPYLLASVRGRMYYNISNWYRLFLQIPGMDFAIAGWEAALGIENRYQRPPPTRRALARQVQRFWLARAIMILLYGGLRLPSRFRAFYRGLAEATSTVDRLLSADPTGRYRDTHELVAWIEHFMDELAPSYSAQIVNDFIAQQLFRVVEIVLQRAGVADAHSVRNELFCGEQGMHSVDPVRSTLELAEWVRRESALRALIDGDASQEVVWEAVVDDDRFGPFYRRCMQHVAAYGDRTVNELKLETDTMAEQPAQLITIIRNYLRADRNIDEMEVRERSIRRAAERTAKSALSDSFPRRLLFAIVLRQARRAVKERENMRLGRSRCFGLAKRVYRQLGAEFRDAGLLDDPRDIFFLTYQEIISLTRGTFVDADPRRLVAERRGDHQRWQCEVLDSRIVVSGIAAAHQHHPSFDEYEHEDADMLVGVGCAPGRASAPALVCDDPSAAVAVNGEILVASTTDPGWVFLMVAASGLVSEKGSILSHTAIIGRELGIPTVVGATGATRWVRSGEMLTIDGRAGTVAATDRPSQ